MSSVKASFGFIERADADEAVFFHFNEFITKKDPEVGDEVSFMLARRHNRMSALQITVLPPGSVKLIDDLGKGVEGTVDVSLTRQRDEHQSPLPGKIIIA